MNQRVISFRGSGGRLVELMRTHEGLSMRRPDGRLRISHPGTDIEAEVDLPRRRKNPAGGLYPRQEKAAYVGAVASDARFPGQTPRTSGPASPTGFLKFARAAGKLADRAKVTVRAEAGWFGTKASKGSGPANHRVDSGRLAKTYGALGLKPDGAAIRNELRGYANLRDRQQVARMIRVKPPLVRFPH